jgi:hypothetical protein
MLIWLPICCLVQHANTRCQSFYFLPRLFLYDILQITSELMRSGISWGQLAVRRESITHTKRIEMSCCPSFIWLCEFWSPYGMGFYFMMGLLGGRSYTSYPKTRQFIGVLNPSWMIFRRVLVSKPVKIAVLGDFRSKSGILSIPAGVLTPPDEFVKLI